MTLNKTKKGYTIKLTRAQLKIVRRSLLHVGAEYRLEAIKYDKMKGCDPSAKKYHKAADEIAQIVQPMVRAAGCDLLANDYNG